MLTRNRPKARPTAAAVVAALAVAGGLVTATPAAAAVTCNAPVWKAQYYANTTFSGTPKLTACDTAIAENYGYGDPAGVTLPKDNFSVRWSLTRDFGSGGPFTFSAEAQDGIRVYLDGTRKIDLWRNVTTTQKKSLNLTVPPGRHTLRVDYATWTGAANVKFGYAPRTSASVDTVRPLAPGGVAATYDRNSGRATLRWAANKEMDLAGYRVYRRTGTSPWSRISTAAPRTTTYFTDVPPFTGQVYVYEVRAVDKAGNESAGSADASFTSLDQTGPAAPTGVTVTQDSGIATLSWPADPDAVKYAVYAASTAAGPFEWRGTTTTTSYRTGAPTNSPQYYRLQAYDRLGNASAFSATFAGDGVDRTPAAPPLDLNSVVRPGRTELHWTAPPNFFQDFDNGGGYRVYRSPGTVLDPSALTRVTCAEGSRYSSSRMNECHDLDMTPGVYYTYTATTVDPAGNESALSAPLTVRTGDLVAPAPVTGLTATPRGDGVLLNWTASAEDDLAGYWAWTGLKQADGTLKWVVSHCWEGPADPLAVLCGDLPDGDDYVFAVTGKDRWGNTLHPSDPAVAKVAATELDLRPSVTVTQDWVPARLNHGRTTDGTTGTFIEWACSNTTMCPTVTGYRISRWNPETGAYEPLHADPIPARAQGIVTRWVDTTATPRNTYFYTLQALRADGSVAGTYVWDYVYQDRV
ncbi:PA14 domain-containing protein [Streptomyces sp. NPDC094032]|uniref:fibronectin type III domain-containing protein n=1 Tax=Streptomyces sp. NPDC094032 TaxID=3155308 RepID=UPI0033271029